MNINDIGYSKILGTVVMMNINKLRRTVNWLSVVRVVSTISCSRPSGSRPDGKMLSSESNPVMFQRWKDYVKTLVNCGERF